MQDSDQIAGAGRSKGDVLRLFLLAVCLIVAGLSLAFWVNPRDLEARKAPGVSQGT